MRRKTWRFPDVDLKWVEQFSAEHGVYEQDVADFGIIVLRELLKSLSPELVERAIAAMKEARQEEAKKKEQQG